MINEDESCPNLHQWTKKTGGGGVDFLSTSPVSDPKIRGKSHTQGAYRGVLKTLEYLKTKIMCDRIRTVKGKLLFSITSPLPKSKTDTMVILTICFTLLLYVSPVGTCRRKHEMDTSLPHFKALSFLISIASSSFDIWEFLHLLLNSINRVRSDRYVCAWSN